MAKFQTPSNTPEGILARIKNKLLITMGLDSYHLKTVVDRYIAEVFAKYPGSKTQSTKTNTLSALSKLTMTIKVFFQFLKILRINKVKFTITVTTSRGREFTVTDEVNLLSVLEEPNDHSSEQ